MLAEHSLSGLYAITDSTLMLGDMLFAKAGAALRGGCTMIQYRNKSASEAVKKREAQSLQSLCRHYEAMFIINDDINLALDIGADGIHLGQTDTALHEARKRLGEHKVIGVSCHNSIDLALAAQKQGASYVAFGRFFDSRTKPDAPSADIAILQRAKQQLRIPVVAIGGITRDNAMRVIEQGADMIAVINDLFATDDLDQIEKRADMFTQLF